MASAGLGVPINLEYASAADGVAAEDLYPLDVEKSLAKVSELGSKVVLWDNAPKALQDVANGDTAMTWAYAPAVLGAIGEGQPISASAPEGTAVTSQLGVTMNIGPNGQEAGNAFLDWWFRTENQVAYSEGTNFGIVVPSERVLSELTAEQSAYLPFAEPAPENYHVIDYDFYSEEGEDGENNLAKILNAWNEFRAN